jgi:endoglucanase
MVALLNIDMWLRIFGLSILIGISVQRCEAGVQYTGVNLSGAEFGPAPTPANRGVFGSDYTYPTSAEVDYFIGKGVNTFRLPFRWERLQPTLNGALYSAEFNRLNNFVNYATAHGASVILDPHNFARYYPDPANFQSSAQGLVGSAVPNSGFADFWSRMANAYKLNSRVIFNLMNEPNTMPTEQWVSASNAAISSIRSTGANNLVLVPGNAWTGAWTWNQNWYGTPNATAMLNVVDPANNFAFDAHQYLDDDGSGTSATITNDDPMTGVQRLANFTSWLKANNRRGFLGEFAVANSTIGTASSQIGDETLNNMLSNINANNDVWLGWSWWSAGPWWGEYMFTLEPTNLGLATQGDRAAMSVLKPYLAGVPEPGSMTMLGAAAGAALLRGRRSPD